MAASGWDSLAALIRLRDPQCRGVVILGLNQPLAHLAESFRLARNPIVRGFMVGRSIWAQPSARWLAGEIDDQALVVDVAQNFSTLVAAWRERHATPA